MAGESRSRGRGQKDTANRRPVPRKPMTETLQLGSMGLSAVQKAEFLLKRGAQQQQQQQRNVPPPRATQPPPKKAARKTENLRADDSFASLSFDLSDSLDEFAASSISISEEKTFVADPSDPYSQIDLRRVAIPKKPPPAPPPRQEPPQKPLKKQSPSTLSLTGVSEEENSPLLSDPSDPYSQIDLRRVAAPSKKPPPLSSSRQDPRKQQQLKKQISSTSSLSDFEMSDDSIPTTKKSPPRRQPPPAAPPSTTTSFKNTDPDASVIERSKAALTIEVPITSKPSDLQQRFASQKSPSALSLAGATSLSPTTPLTSKTYANRPSLGVVMSASELIASSMSDDRTPSPPSDMSFSSSLRDQRILSYSSLKIQDVPTALRPLPSTSAAPAPVSQLKDVPQSGFVFKQSPSPTPAVTKAPSPPQPAAQPIRTWSAPRVQVTLSDDDIPEESVAEHVVSMSIAEEIERTGASPVPSSPIGTDIPDEVESTAVIEEEDVPEEVKSTSEGGGVMEDDAIKSSASGGSRGSAKVAQSEIHDDYSDDFEGIASVMQPTLSHATQGRSPSPSPKDQPTTAWQQVTIGGSSAPPPPLSVSAPTLTVPQLFGRQPLPFAEILKPQAMTSSSQQQQPSSSLSAPAAALKKDTGVQADVMVHPRMSNWTFALPFDIPDIKFPSEVLNQVNQWATAEMFRRQLDMLRLKVDTDRFSHEIRQARVQSGYRYTTMEDTREFIMKNRPKDISLEEAARLVAEQEKWSI